MVKINEIKIVLIVFYTYKLSKFDEYLPSPLRRFLLITLLR